MRVVRPFALGLVTTADSTVGHVAACFYHERHCWARHCSLLPRISGDSGVPLFLEIPSNKSLFATREISCNPIVCARTLPSCEEKTVKALGCAVDGADPY
jgi:hypothetical protein